MGGKLNSATFEGIENFIINIINKINKEQMDLSGDRAIEWSFVISNIPKTKGLALEFGPGPSNIGLIAARLGYIVNAIDLTPCKWKYEFPNLTYQQTDILQKNFTNNYYDLIINSSTIEHVGLPGRYGNKKSKSDGDLEAMDILHSILKDQGIMILTIPVGIDDIFIPYHRIYGKERILKLLKNFNIIKQEYWKKNNNNIWKNCEKDRAFSTKGSENYYALGCYVLAKINEE